MDRLDKELQRLFPAPASPDAPRRVLAIDFRQSADWPALAACCQALVEELALPAPAISVDGQIGRASGRERV